jgi:hypothetical protein
MQFPAPPNSSQKLIAPFSRRFFQNALVIHCLDRVAAKLTPLEIHDLRVSLSTAGRIENMAQSMLTLLYREYAESRRRTAASGCALTVLVTTS